MEQMNDSMSSTEMDRLLQEYAGMLVPYSFNGGFVCLSYAISLVGTGTTLELIRRRTSHRGSHNLLLLVGAAISMGGIAIWSMHFIGNRAIYMLDGQEFFQIAYSTGLTVTSLLVPILVLILAFLGVSGNGRIRWWRIVLAGLLSGGAICGMHYLANASISNYSSSYQLSYLIGSIIIAVLASTTALALFFVFENTWRNAWWKRLGCAMVLAGAVSGMHWCAAVGTSYHLLGHAQGKGLSRQDAMIVVICLAIAAGIVMTSMAAYSSWVRRDYASKSQQVVLAAGVFDEKGRIMVSQDGYLPSEVVTDTYLPKSNDDVFNTSHPLFHWMFRASRNWDTISKVMSKMTNHISLLAQERNAPRADVKLVGEDGVLIDDYDTILRELFCLTAEALANKTKETLQHAGTLWDEIFVTGEVSKSHPRQRLMNNSNSSSNNHLQDGGGGSGSNSNSNKFNLHSLAEKGFQPHATSTMQEYGRGCLMFLVRQVDTKRDIERLEAAGFRFAEVHQVVSTIRSSMHIKTPDLESRLRNMSSQKDKTTLLTPGVHVGIFAVRARLDRSGFDVLAQRTAKNLLPSVALSTSYLEPCHSSYLRSLRGMTLAAILARIEKQQQQPQPGSFVSPHERLFASDLRDAISEMRNFLGDEAFDDATLLPKEVELSCFYRKDANKSLSQCTLIAFQLVLPIHASLLAPQCEFTPLNFFKMRQLTYEGSTHHVDFSHMVHRDISSAVHHHESSYKRLSAAPQVPTRIFHKAMDKVRDSLPGGHQRRGGGGGGGGMGMGMGMGPGSLPSSLSSSNLAPSKSQELLSSKMTSVPSSIYARDDSDDGSFDASRKSSTASHLSSSKELEVAPKSPSKKLHVFGGIMVSQEVSINVQETTSADNLPDQKGSELVTLHPRSEKQTKLENYYSATATGENNASGLARQQEAAFVDELLTLSMQADKRASA